ncbi:alpha/beta hydrolase [Rhodococcus sp. NPDC058521]|uniref:alpha/beta hydrolase n=1 Tax=Rhodococcus sp. NPDC058521 TaxID=3346536 RepID=UPI0036534402
MHRKRLPSTAVVLPGTGSDADFVDRTFAPALTAAGVRVVPVEPDPRRVVGSYRDALRSATAEAGSILVGGVSIGAAVALEWAAEHPATTFGVLAGLPAWTGRPHDAPAAASARFTSDRLGEMGLEAVTADMIESSPPWLGRELAKSWRSQWPGLPDALREAAEYHALDKVQLAELTVPVGIAAAVDDAVHPIGVACEWAARIPRAALAALTLDEIGADPSALGRAAFTALTDLLG